MPMREPGLIIFKVAASVALAATSLTAAEFRPTGTSPKLGQPLSKEAADAVDLDVFPSGEGLPNGNGTPAAGKKLYIQHCSACHGEDGRGATAEELIGGPNPPTNEAPAKSIGPYWPYATTLFDFIRRTKPPASPKSLSNDDVYALVAYLLAANEVIPGDQEMNRRSLPQVKMPNRNGFIRIDAP